MTPAAHVPAIVGRIVVLVALSVFAAAVVNLAITFNGPPPMPPPSRLADVAAALAEQVPQAGPEQPLSMERNARTPAPRPGEVRDPAIEAAVARQLGVPASSVRAYMYRMGPAQPPPGGPAPSELRGEFTIARQGADGWTVARNTWRDTALRWQLTVLGAMGAVLVLLTLIAWWVAREITRPLARLAEAADAVRAGDRGPAARITGPPEIVRVADALNAMRARLLDHVAARTSMLAAITHDLGTPLTRLAFRIERMADADRMRAAADIDEMREMIASVLEFARGEARAHAPLDLRPLLQALADDMAATGATVSLSAGEPLPMSGDAASLRRLFTNLVENALRYGRSATLTARRANGRALVTVDDEGPGIAPMIATRLFEPFFRGEPSRSRDTGGIGLGLAIARNIAEAHHGAIVADNRPEGGARFTVSLPLADVPFQRQ